MMRRILAIVPWLAIVLVMALLARQEVSNPAPAVPNTPGVVQVTAWIPFRVLDQSGATLICSSSLSGVTFPPMLKVGGDPTVAPSGGAYIAPGATRSTNTTYAPGGGNE